MLWKVRDLEKEQGRRDAEAIQVAKDSASKWETGRLQKTNFTTIRQDIKSRSSEDIK